MEAFIFISVAIIMFWITFPWLVIVLLPFALLILFLMDAPMFVAVVIKRTRQKMRDQSLTRAIDQIDDIKSKGRAA